MYIKRAIVLGVASLWLATLTTQTGASDEVPTKRGVFIQAKEGANLAVDDEKVRFRKGKRDLTLWTIEFRMDRFRILDEATGKPLGIDAKSKELRLLDKADPNTLWQYKSGGADPKPTNSFKVIIFMNVGDEELRLSTNDTGTAILSGKADLLLFSREGP